MAEYIAKEDNRFRSLPEEKFNLFYIVLVSGRFLVWQIFLNGFLFFVRYFYLNNYI
jgi:hypothetical protein